MKKVDTAQYVTVLKELVEEGKSVSMLIAGSSMEPFLCHYRDTIFFEKPKREIRKGDMVFYQRESGQYVMHRVCRVKDDGYYMVGDNQTEIEGPLKREQIFALITQVRRKGKMMGPGDFWWEFFAKVWLRLLPVRKPISHLYARLTKFVRK